MNAELAILWSVALAIWLAFGAVTVYHVCRWLGRKLAAVWFGSGRPR